MNKQRGWIGVDLDGTLAQYDGWKGEAQIGEPIPKMVRRVKRWLAEGRDVRIFTARISGSQEGDAGIAKMCEAIGVWCAQHIGVALPVTNVKDYAMIELWDDRAVQVIPNTGERADGEA